MSDSTTTIKAAQVTAIVASAFASGGILTLSFLAVPALLLPGRPSRQPQPGAQPPATPAVPLSHITQQWLWIYNTGKVIFPSIAASSALAYSYLAYVLAARSDRLSRLYLTAAAMTMAILPYTVGVMLPTNKQLEEHAAREFTAKKEGEKVETQGEEEKVQTEKENREVPCLMVKWAWLNAIRGLFPLMGAIVGATASL